MSNVLLEARSVSRQYPGTLALDGVDFQLKSGHVSALIGENGAGKSTLVKILGGVEQPSSGSLAIDGQPVHFRSVRDADALGIAMIHQELNLCHDLSVAENMFLGREISRNGIVDRAAQESAAREVIGRLGEDIDVRALAGDLPLGRQQIVEIARALSRDARVVMMDEPTSALSAAEIAVLFRIIADLKSKGVAILYISHRLEELLQVADSVTVLRDGRVVGESPAASIDAKWIVSRMTGRDSAPMTQRETTAGEVALRVESCRNVSFSVRAGEVLGLYGLMGAGRTELLETLMGLRKESSGSIKIGDISLQGGPPERIAAGLAMVPEDRKTSGLFHPLSVRANLTLASVDRLARGWWLSPRAEQSAAEQFAARLRLKGPGLEHNIGSLSGGNQQKAVLGRCLMISPKVLLLDEPTRGVDVGAKAEIHSIIRDLAAEGMAIVLVSSELEEIRAVSDRILVMSRGSVTGEFSAAQTADESLSLAAGGQHASS